MVIGRKATNRGYTSGDLCEENVCVGIMKATALPMECLKAKGFTKNPTRIYSPKVLGSMKKDYKARTKETLEGTLPGETANESYS